MAQIGRAQPTNDLFASRTVIDGTDVLIDVPSLSGTVEPGEPQHLAPTPTRRSLWWTWTAPADGCASVKFDECMGNATILIVYTGNSITDLIRVASSAEGTFTTGWVRVRGGEAYAIAAAGSDQNLSGGGAILHLEFYPPPPNDNLAQATPLNTNCFTLQGWTVGATPEPGEPAYGLPGPKASVWYDWTVAETGMAEVYVSTWDYTGLSGVFEGSSLDQLKPIEVNYRTLLPTFLAEAGHTYHIAVTSSTNFAFQGEFTISGCASSWRVTSPTSGTEFPEATNIVLRLENTPASLQPERSVYDYADNVSYSGTNLGTEVITAEMTGGDHTLSVVGVDTNHHYFMTIPVSFRVLVPHDNFAERQPLTGAEFVVTGDTRGASSEPGEPGTGSSIWFTWQAPSTGYLIVDGLFSSPNGRAELFTGDVLASLVAAPHPYHEWTRDIFGVQAGTIYQIRVSDAYTKGDLFRARLSEFPINDSFAARSIITNFNERFEIPIGLATLEAQEPPYPYVPVSTQASVWYTFTASSPGLLELAGLGCWVGVYTGTSLEQLQFLTNSDQLLPIEAGRTYQFAVVGQTFQQSNVTFVFKFHPRPLNDNFAAAQVLPPVAGLVDATCLWATLELGEPGIVAPAKSVWYRFSAPTDGYLLHEATNLAPVTLWVSQPFVRGYVGPSLQSLVTVTNLSGPECGPSGYSDPSEGVAPVLAVSAGQEYFLQVLTDDSSGGFRLRYEFVPRATNDDFIQRSPIEGLRASWTAATYGASSEPGEPLHFSWMTNSRSLWYSWTAPTNGWLRLLSRVEAGARPAVLTAYEGTSVSNLTIVEGIRQGRTDFWDPSNPVLFYPPDPRFPPRDCRWVPVRAGRVYALAVAAGATASGQSDCSKGGLVHCELDFGTWELAAPSEGSVFHLGDPVELRVLMPNPAFEGNLPPVELWMALQGSYYIAYQTIGVLTNAPFSVSLTNLYPGLYMVGALATNSSGEWRHTPPVRFYVQPANDLFDSRRVLQGIETNFNDTVGGASAESGEPGVSPGAPSVWYSWTAPSYGLVSFAVFTVHLSTAEWVSVYEGKDLTNLTLVAESSDVDAWNARYGQFAARAGIEYQFRVAALSYGESDFLFQLTEQPFEIRLLSVDSQFLKYRVSGIGGRPVTVESTTDLLTWSTEQISPSGLEEFDFEIPISGGTGARLVRARLP